MCVRQATEASGNILLWNPADPSSRGIKFSICVVHCTVIIKSLKTRHRAPPTHSESES